MVARDGTTKYVSCSFSFLFSNKRKTNRNLLLFSSSTDFIEATGGANRFIGWRRLVARFQMVEWRMAGGSFYFRIAQIWMRIVLGWQCLRSRPAIGQQFALFWIAPFHASVLEPYFHLQFKWHTHTQKQEKTTKLNFRMTIDQHKVKILRNGRFCKRVWHIDFVRWWGAYMTYIRHL